MSSASNLEKVLASGQFAVTAELGPPKNADAQVIRAKAKLLSGCADAVNITDCQTAIVRMSSIASSVVLMQEGLEPVTQMTCRDRNRIAIQSDLLGASALGLKNLLCLTGDHQTFGNHPNSTGVFDMDSIQLLQMVRMMRDEKVFQCGEEIKGKKPDLFLGAAANPFAPGVTPPKSIGMARYMKDHVPGMDVPDHVIARLKGAKDAKKDVQKEGINICVDIINRVKEIEGVAGVHIMAIEWESAVPEIVKQAGLLPRP